MTSQSNGTTIQSTMATQKLIPLLQGVNLQFNSYCRLFNKFKV